MASVAAIRLCPVPLERRGFIHWAGGRAAGVGVCFRARASSVRCRALFYDGFLCERLTNAWSFSSWSRTRSPFVFL